MLQRSPTYILSLPAEDGIAVRLRKLLGERRGVRGHPVEERRGDHADLPAQPAPARHDPRLDPADGGQAAAGRVRRRHPLQAGATTRGTSGCAWCPTATCSRPSGTGGPRWSPTAIKTFTERGVRTRVRRRAGGRHRGDRDRPAAARAGRRRARRGRPAGPAARDDGLQGHDAQRRAELRLHHRLHQRVLDAEGGPGERVRLPAAPVHGRSTATTPACRSTTTRPSPPQPLLDFQAGYVLRSIDQFPRAGSRPPWRLGQSYAHDVVTLRHGKIDDGSCGSREQCLLEQAGTQPVR